MTPPFFFLIRFPIIAEMLNWWMRPCPCVHFDSRGVVVRAYVKTDYFIKVVGGRHNPENTASARLARKTNFVCCFFFWLDPILLCITTTVCICSRLESWCFEIDTLGFKSGINTTVCRLLCLIITSNLLPWQN